MHLAEAGKALQEQAFMEEEAFVDLFTEGERKDVLRDVSGERRAVRSLLAIAL